MHLVHRFLSFNFVVRQSLRKGPAIPFPINPVGLVPNNEALFDWLDILQFPLKTVLKLVSVELRRLSTDLTGKEIVSCFVLMIETLFWKICGQLSIVVLKYSLQQRGHSLPETV